jgi:predicted  nucleic acid-binding Zn-ribbon protein
MNNMIVIERVKVLELKVRVLKLEEALWEAIEIMKEAGLDVSDQRAVLAKTLEMEAA